MKIATLRYITTPLWRTELPEVEQNFSEGEQNYSEGKSVHDSEECLKKKLNNKIHF